MEEGYGNNAYHSSIHAADVLLSTNLFLTKFGMRERMSDVHKLAALLGASMQSCNHHALPFTARAPNMAIPLPIWQVRSSTTSTILARVTRTR